MGHSPPVASAEIWRARHYTEQIVHLETPGCYPIKPTHKKTLGEKGQTKKKKKKKKKKKRRQTENAKRGSTLAVRGTSKRKKHYHAQRSANDEARTHDLSLTLSWRFT